MISKKKDIRLLLDNIRSVHNVGSIFRTAETCGISHIYCIGTTPVPIDRFGRLRKDFAKVSLGAEKTVTWEHSKTSSELIKKLKNEKFRIIAIEQAKGSLDYKKVKVKDRAIVIFGNEVEGVNKALLHKSDVIAEIPMKGEKESLNVSVSAGIALFRILNI